MAALAKDPAARPAGGQALAKSLFTALDTAQVALRRRQVLRLLIPSLAAPVLGWAAWRIFPTSKPADVLTEFGAVRLTHPAGVWRSVFLGDGTTLVTRAAIARCGFGLRRRRLEHALHRLSARRARYWRSLRRPTALRS